jgi:tRNA A-37 threonylcarbamoyl transferase component Bud32
MLYTAEFGAIPLTKVREVFKYSNPNEVAAWVTSLESWLKKQRVLTLEVFVRALQRVEQDIPDTLSAALLADYCRKIAKSKDITEFKVLELARGLQILVPDLVRVEQKGVVISAHPDKLVKAISAQLEQLKKASESSMGGQ